MSYLLLKSRFALEVPKINRALSRAEKTLPPSVQPVAHHIFEAGGKRLRPLLTVLFSRLLGYTESDCYDLAISLEMLHAATLLHDDIIDSADLRRGKPAAHTVFSPTVTVLAGDALLAEGNRIVARFSSTALSDCFARATSETCAGEIAEIAAQRNPDLSEEEFLSIIRGKTARLISCACEMGAILAKADARHIQASADFGENIGIAFQLVDDALDFAPAEDIGKPSGGDLREGKFTMPIRSYQESLSQEERVHFAEAFRKNTFSDADYEHIIREIHTRRFDHYARLEASRFLEKALSALNVLPSASEKELLAQMTDYIRDRKK